MKLFVLVTGLCVFFAAAAAQRRTGSRAGTSTTSAKPLQIIQRIDTSRGTCTCVPYYDCPTDQTVDTTIFRLGAAGNRGGAANNGKTNTTTKGTSRSRVRRQFEERVEQCKDLFVCCLTTKDSSDPTTTTISTTPTTTTEVFRPPPVDPTDPTDPSVPCQCFPYWRCGQNETSVITAGMGLINPRIPPCEGEEVVCCHKSFFNMTTKAPFPTPEPGIPRTCGTRYMNDDFSMNRIQTAGGNGQTLFAEYPWTLVILKSQTLANGAFSGNVFLCGASLIQPSIAITAAHCVHETPASSLKVRAGEWDTRPDNPLEVIDFQEQRVVDVIIHPDFHNGTLHNDIAILRLAAPFTPTDNIGLICLPPEDSPDPTNCIATGWGKAAFRRDAQYQTIMKQVSLPYVKPDDCQVKLRNTRLGEYFILDKSFNCAGGVADEDTCTGDGGGPLSCIVPGSDQFYLIGITSWGIECGMKNVPGVYTNVRHFSDWISSKLE